MLSEEIRKVGETYGGEAKREQVLEWANKVAILEATLNIATEENYTFFSFRKAIREIIKGNCVSRATWAPSEQIFLITGRTVEGDTFRSWKNNANKAFPRSKIVVIEDHIDKKMPGDRYITGWLPTLEDLLSNDWYVVNN